MKIDNYAAALRIYVQHNMKRVTEQHKAVDGFVNEAFSEAGCKSCCRAGCFACCSEPVYCSEAEALHILEAVKPADLDQLRANLQEWLFKTRSLRGEYFPKALKWLGLNVPCPLLKDGLCSVYERRPFSCRVWFAMEKPENCQLPARRNQKFAEFNSRIFVRMGVPASVGGKIVMDHMSVLLAEKLLGLEIPSGSREISDAGDVASGWRQRNLEEQQRQNANV